MLLVIFVILFVGLFVGAFWSASYDLFGEDEMAPCVCDTFRMVIQEPEPSITYNESFHEFSLPLKEGHQLTLFYCPFCGGRMPDSLRATQEELDRVRELVSELRTESQVREVLGEPTRTFDFELIRKYLPDGRTYEEDEKFVKAIQYEQHSDTVDVYVKIEQDGSIEIEVRSKVTEESA